MYFRNKRINKQTNHNNNPDLFHLFLFQLLTMSLQTRYDSCLANLLSLFQSAILKTLSKKSIDFVKFYHQFLKTFNQMVEIQQQFSVKAKKLSNQIVKLKHLLQNKEDEQNQASSLSSRTNFSNGDDLRSPLRMRPIKRVMNKSSQLNRIQQVQQENSFKIICSNNKHSQIQQKQQRLIQSSCQATNFPLKQHRKQLKTINLESLCHSHQGHKFTDNFQHNKEMSENTLTLRNSLYDELKRQSKSTQKYNNKSSSKTTRYKWNHKIKRLI